MYSNLVYHDKLVCVLLTSIFVHVCLNCDTCVNLIICIAVNRSIYGSSVIVRIVFIFVLCQDVVWLGLGEMVGTCAQWSGFFNGCCGWYVMFEKSDDEQG